MRINDFICKECGEIKEEIYKEEEEVKKICECGGERVKKMSAPRVKFVGSGWETNDHLDFWADTKDKQTELTNGKGMHNHKDFSK